MAATSPEERANQHHGGLTGTNRISNSANKTKTKRCVWSSKKTVSYVTSEIARQNTVTTAALPSESESDYYPDGQTPNLAQIDVLEKRGIDALNWSCVTLHR